MVENFALPRWDDAPRPRLANNSLTIRNTREFVRDQAHLSVLSYDVGIGFDPVYPPRRHQQGIGEAAACGASMTIKGTEYNDGQRMTLLTDPAYEAQQMAIGHYHRWLAEHHLLYQGRTNLAPVGLLHPEEDLWRSWMGLAPVYYGAGQALTRAGIPWRVVRAGDRMTGLAVLLTFTPYHRNYKMSDETIQQVHVPALPGWAWRKMTAVARGGLWHDLVEGLGLFLLRSYHGSKLARQVMDKMNMAKLVTQTALFDLPEKSLSEGLLTALPTEVLPRVEGQFPTLIEVWQKGDQTQVHLLNYGPKSQVVTVHFSEPVQAKVHSPDQIGIIAVEGQRLPIELDIYSILILENSTPKQPESG